MNIKITRLDGTIIEAEGTVEECERLVAAISPQPPAPQLTFAPQSPVFVPMPYPVPTPEIVPYWSYPGQWSPSTSPIWYTGDPLPQFPRSTLCATA